MRKAYIQPSVNVMGLHLTTFLCASGSIPVGAHSVNISGGSGDIIIGGYEPSDANTGL